MAIMRRMWVCGYAVLCFTLAVAPAAAQSRKRAAPERPATASDGAPADQNTPSGYDAAISNALREFELENYAEARSGFREAHRLYPNARTFRALGMVEFELKNYKDALEYLKQALDSEERRLSDTQRSGAEQLLTRARSYVGHYRVSLRPTNAHLLVDGAAPPLDGAGVVVLSVGEHTLEADADGHRPFRRELHVGGGEDEAIDVLLLPLQVARSESSKPDAPAIAPTPVYKKWWLWTTLGVLVAGGIATGLVLGLRKSEPGEASGGNTNTVLRLPPAGMSSGR
jgi:hypothetical protein